MSSSVQFDSGNTRTLSPLRMRALYRFHSSGRWFFGSQRCCALRNENTRSLARDFSSSRRAPPMAASNLYLSSACLSDWVFMMSVCTAEPCVNGPTPWATPSWLMCTISLQPVSSARRSRNSVISRNFHVVSTCISGIGGGAGWKALSIRCSSTEESLPTEYSITGLANSAATSRMMWMLSSSRRFRCDAWANASISPIGHSLQSKPCSVTANPASAQQPRLYGPPRAPDPPQTRPTLVGAPGGANGNAARTGLRDTATHLEGRFATHSRLPPLPQR